MIEKLTEDEREAVRRGTCQASGPKALRLIDQQSAELARLREKLGLTERTLLTAIRAADAEGDQIDAKLATANALLAEWAHGPRDRLLLDRTDAHLSGAEPAPTHAEAEQAVLDAVGAMADSALRYYFGEGSGGLPAVCRAELTRRGVKP